MSGTAFANHPHSEIRRLLTVVSALACALALGIGVATPAEAATWRTISGRPGSVGLPKVYGYAGNVSSATVYLPARTVTRSPATTGSQRAGMVARLWHYDGSTWRLEQQSPLSAAAIPAGRSSATLGALQFNPWNVGDYSVDFVVSWVNSAGANIGGLYVDENAAADYACASGAPSYCSANRVVGGSGSIWLWL